MLNKGSIIYYSNRKDANQDSNRKGTYFLNNAFIKEYPSNGSHDFPAYSWTINVKIFKKFFISTEKIKIKLNNENYTK